MQNLQDLITGKYSGTKKIKLSCDLQELPTELFDLQSSLESLDLSNNSLVRLPDEFRLLQRLKILFLSDNDFREYPQVLSQIPSLEMIAFKNNGMEHIPENSFGANLRWLILTNNKIAALPESIGDCKQMEKLMLAGNALTRIPDNMKNLKKLALLRLSANKLKHIPPFIFQLPNLAFLAFAGNPCLQKEGEDTPLQTVAWSDLEIGLILGQGASGLIYKAHWASRNQAVAVKVFKGEVTSDGLPEDEMRACMVAGSHSNLIDTIGQVRDHSELRKALVLQLISPDYQILGDPPSMESCSRDCFSPMTRFPIASIMEICKSVVSAAAHLHSVGISHGDLYAHNTLVTAQGHALLGDFGAATVYGTNHGNKQDIERLEVRAFGHLLQDLVTRVATQDAGNPAVGQLKNLHVQCVQTRPQLRPDFTAIKAQLSSMQFG